MLYIVSSEKEGIQFGDYLEALESYRERLPPEVARFASDENRFALNHPSSLHDAWVEEVAIKESRSTGDAASQARILLTLLGQTHDRHIILIYSGVTEYLVSSGSNLPSNRQTFHGDIWTHEVRITDGDEVIHEIALADGGRFEVTCRSFSIAETPTTAVE